MIAIISREANFPQIVDRLSDGQLGYDLSGQGFLGGAPGEKINFSLFVRLSPSDVELQQFDLAENIGLYIGKASVYTGDYTSPEDLQDLLDTDILFSVADNIDRSYGQPNFTFKLNNGDKYDNRLIIKKEWIFYINNNVITPAVGLSPVNISSMDFVNNEILFSGNPINKGVNYSGITIYNNTKSETKVIYSQKEDGSGFVFTDSVSDWDIGDELYIPELEHSLDGALGIGDSRETYGSYARMDFEFEIPNNYSAIGIKQFKLVVSGGN